MIDLSIYSKVKDNCCFGYFGECLEYLLQLAYFRPIIEKQLPGLTIYIAAQESSLHLLEHETRILTMDQMNEKKSSFGFIHEILCDCERHPIEKILAESSINFLPSRCSNPPENNRCLIVSHGGYPTRKLGDDQASMLRELALSRGLKPEFGDNPESVGHVWGVESWQVWNHAQSVSQEGTLLVETGIGSNFYRANFPDMQFMYL